MFTKNHLVFLLLLLLSGSYAAAQQTVDSLDAKYGLDPVLFNGKRYGYYPHAETVGSQFFPTADFQTGSIEVRGILYTNQQLNFDAYNQQLILQYRTDLDAKELLIVSEAWLNSFSIGKLHFALLPLTDTTRRICQVIDAQGLSVAYAWRKDLILDTQYGATNHVFAKPVKESYVGKDNEYARFRNNKSFIRCFEKTKQPLIKKFMRKNHYNVKRIDDDDMLHLLMYCTSIQNT